VPETTAPSTTTTPPPDTPKLPTTGGDRSLGFVALWIAGLGGVILAARRRLSTSP
jgi:LPXTG-motif cell wall-anchored protein